MLQPLVAAVLALAVIAMPDLPRDVTPAEARFATFTSTLEWRNIGPSRGGRVCAVAGVPGDPNTYYFGATGGGVWKSTNAGHNWTNITDGFFKTGSVGAIAVSTRDPNVIYVGTGEGDVRGNFSHGDGVYRSTDAGKTWTNIGLRDSRQISAIAVHPDDPDVVFVAALGNILGPSSERGLYRSTNGGETWERVLYVDDRTGACDVAIDPRNPRIMFAGFWRVTRTPWELSSGGEGSGLFRSTDGGATWKRVTSGLPKGIVGKVGVSPSPARAGRVYAIVEHDKGGVFVSDDSGESWRNVNSDRELRQRAWYYTHIIADTQDADTVYVLNVGLHRSTNGGRSFGSIRAPHSDHHDLWIAPEDSSRIINGNDGGANVSFDACATWSRQDNQPTAQFYRVTTDNAFPYRVLGAQQDNSTVSISSQGFPGTRDFYDIGGGESGYIAVRPDDPDIVFAGSYMGYLTRYDHSTDSIRNIMVWPQNTIGLGAVDAKYRFQWTFPIIISPHDPDTLYVGANVIFKSNDEGESWTAISPDLTTNDPTKQQSSGGPITKDNTGVEYYCTVFTIAESPRQPGTIWAGSDDGLIHVTTDGGANWTNVTPPNMGDWPMISLIEASPHDANTAYAAVTRYKMNDYSPMIYKTTDLGKTWSKITDGIPAMAFVRSVREDPVRKGLLFAGTELGVFCSIDDGKSWRSLQRNLPVVPVTDVAVKEDDLVIATQGRSFWIMDSIAPLRQYSESVFDAGAHLFTPEPAYRRSWDRVRIDYFLKESPERSITLTVLDGDGKVVREFKSSAREGEDPADMGDDSPWRARARQRDRIPASSGMNRFEWRMRHADPERMDGLVTWPSMPQGPMAIPGTYTARLTVGNTTLDQTFEVLADPRVDASPDQMRAQQDILLKNRDLVSEIVVGVRTIRSVRAQVDDTLDRARRAGIIEKKAAKQGEPTPDEPAPAEDAAGADTPASTDATNRDASPAPDAPGADVPATAVASSEGKPTGKHPLEDKARALKDAMAEVEKQLVAVEARSSQDTLNYGVRLADNLASLAYTVESSYPVTKQAAELAEELFAQVRTQLDALKVVLDTHLTEFNSLVTEHGVPAVAPPKQDPDEGE